MLAQIADPLEKSYCRRISPGIGAEKQSPPEIGASVGPLLLRQVPYSNRIPARRGFWFALNKLMREYEELRV
jgi:hypothetical protein